MEELFEGYKVNDDIIDLGYKFEENIIEDSMRAIKERELKFKNENDLMVE